MKIIAIALLSMTACGSSARYDYCGVSCSKASACLSIGGAQQECVDECMKAPDPAHTTDAKYAAAAKTVQGMNCQQYAASICPNLCSVAACFNYCH